MVAGISWPRRQSGRGRNIWLGGDGVDGLGLGQSRDELFRCGHYVGGVVVDDYVVVVDVVEFGVVLDVGRVGFGAEVVAGSWGVRGRCLGDAVSLTVRCVLSGVGRVGADAEGDQKAYGVG
jgi:hypothetical protein